MWLLLMFDLPTDTTKLRKAYTAFRKGILKDGFIQMQYSIYIRHCASDKNASVHFQRVKAGLPEKGEVRILLITDKQFERMHVFTGKMRRKAEKAPAQLEFF